MSLVSSVSSLDTNFTVSIERRLHSTDHKNIGLTGIANRRIRMNQFGAQLLHFSVWFFPFFSEIDTSHLVYLVLSLGNVYVLFIYIVNRRHLVRNSYSFQYPTYWELAYKDFFTHHIICSIYHYVFLSLLVSYSLVLWLGFSGQHFWMWFISFYFILRGLKSLVCIFVELIAYCLQRAKHTPLIFLGLRFEWATWQARSDWRTSIAVCMLVNIFLDSSALEFGYQAIGLWFCCWILPGLWARFVLLLCYPMLYLFSKRLPLLWYGWFAAAHNLYGRIVFGTSILFMIGLPYLGWLDPCWALYARNFLFMGYIIYALLVIPVTFTENGFVPTSTCSYSIQGVFSSHYQFDKHLKMSNGVWIPVTEEAAIAFFHHSIIGLLGVSWYTWAYGERVYFQADAHKQKKLTLYQKLFVATNYYDCCDWSKYKSSSRFEEALTFTKRHFALLYDFDWNREKIRSFSPDGIPPRWTFCIMRSTPLYTWSFLVFLQFNTTSYRINCSLMDRTATL